jgi:hypothetical protein
MQTNITTEILQTSPSLLIDRTTLWDNSSKDDENQEKCVAPLNDNAWKSISLLKDLVDSKYGSNINNVRIVFSFE